MAMNGYDKVLVAVEDLKADAIKFFAKGNKSAGTRLRVGLAAISKLCKEARQEIQEMKDKG